MASFRPSLRPAGSRLIVALLMVLLAAAHGCAEGGGPPRRLEVKPMTHPFLFFSSDDVPRLRAEAAGGRKAQFEKLLAWGKLFADFEPLPPAGLPANRDTLQVYHENGAAYVVNMCLLYHLTGQERWYKAAERWLLAFCDYPADTGGNYSVGAYALALAAGYDMLYGRLEAPARDRVRRHIEAVVDRGRKGAESDWWAGLRVHHDHWLPAAGLCVGAAAVAAESPGGAERLRFLLDHLRRAMAAVGDDGAWTEGAANWVYAMSMTLICFDACRRAAGEDLFQWPFIRRTAAYRLYNWLPDDRYIYHHDSFPNGRYNVMGSASCHVMRKLAAELRDGRGQWLADREESIDFRRLESGVAVNAQWAVSKQHLEPSLHAAGWNFLWHDPSVKPVPPEGLPNHAFFPNQGLAVWRSGWEKKDVVFTFTCAPLGGRRAREEVLAGDRRIPANMGHIHALAGAFNIYAHGNYLALPSGYGMRASRHENTLTIEDADQRLDPNGDARILRLESGKDFAYIAGQAADCYGPEAGISRWVRHVAWLAPDVFVIGDELAAPGPSARGRKTVWRMNYQPDGRNPNDVSLDAGTQAFAVAAKDPNRPGALFAQILAPRGVELEKEIVRPPGANWIAFGQVRASVKDIFKDSPRAGIVAVLAAAENRSAQPPVALPIETENVLGAMVQRGEEAVAAVFVRADSKAPREEPLTVRLRAPRGKLRWLLFSLPPETTFEVTASAQASPDGRVLHEITIRKGPGPRTSLSGTLSASSIARQ